MPGLPPQGIFLSYRRDDAGPYARLLQYQLRERFPDAYVFVDMDSIKPGRDFAEVIEEAVNSSAVLVALIGRQWATLTGDDGARRLDNPDDFVRFEVMTALERGVRVIPVLVDGAKPLRRQELPAELHKLARLNALEMSYGRYQFEADRLLDTIQRALSAASEREESREEHDRKAREEAEREVAATTAPVAKARAQQETQIQAPQLNRVKIFLCYRREDTQGFAGRIYDNLANKYGQEQVFRDIDSISAGIRYSTWIESKVSQSNVMIVLIGNAWLSTKDPAGQRRLDSPKDWVRREIETALSHNIPIIPVRIQEARMPPEEELPPSIADLIEFQDAEVTDRRWTHDIGQLIQAIDELTGIQTVAGAQSMDFASKSADQTRQEIINASLLRVITPGLLGHTRSEVSAAMAGMPLYLDAVPATAPDTWIAVSQEPQPNQPTQTGSPVHIVFAGTVPYLKGYTRRNAEAALKTINLVLKAEPSNAAAGSTAQDDQIPAAGSPPPSDRIVTVSFQQP